MDYRHILSKLGHSDPSSLKLHFSSLFPNRHMFRMWRKPVILSCEGNITALTRMWRAHGYSDLNLWPLTCELSYSSNQSAWCWGRVEQFVGPTPPPPPGAGEQSHQSMLKADSSSDHVRILIRNHTEHIMNMTLCVHPGDTGTRQVSSPAEPVKAVLDSSPANFTCWELAEQIWTKLLNV